MAYNGKLVCYASGYQLRLYSKTMNESLDEIESVRVELNPFDGLPVIPGTFETMFDEAEEDPVDSIDPDRSMYNSYARTKNMIYYLARSNIWTHFVTLTFSSAFVDRYDYDACAKKLKIWLDALRRDCGGQLKYLLVPELHKDGAIHFHGLFSGFPEMQLVDSGHTYNGRKVYNWQTYKWGWSTVTVIDDSNKASGYLTKYVTKDLLAVSEGRKRYWASRNLDKAPIFNFHSFDFAGHWARKYLRENFLKECIKTADFVKITSSEFLETYYMEFPADSELIQEVNNTFGMWLARRCV